MTAQIITGWRNRPEAAAPRNHISFGLDPKASLDRNFAIRQVSI